MARYRANSRILGLSVGEEFESSDPFYAPFAEKGYLSVIEDAESPSLAPNGGRKSKKSAEEPEGDESSAEE